MPRKYVLVFFMLLIILVSDQVTKALVIRHVRLNSTIVLVEGYLNITHVRNPGGAFGILAGGGPERAHFVFIPVSLAASALIIFLIATAGERETFKVTALAMILSGALGNLLDRCRWGAVVDFIDIHYGALHWPAFNVADAAISVGVAILIGACMFHRK